MAVLVSKENLTEYHDEVTSLLGPSVYAFLGAGGVVTEVSEGVYDIGTGGIIVYFNGSRYSFPSEDILTQLGEFATSTDGSVRISIGNLYALVFDTVEQTLKRVGIALANKVPYVPLIIAYSQQAPTGFLMDTTWARRIEDGNHYVYAYLTGNKTLEVVNTSTVRYPASSSIAVYVKGAQTEFTSSQVQEMLGADAVTVDAEWVTIVVGGASSIAYDSLTESLVLHSGHSQNFRYYRLLGTRGNNGFTGPLIEPTLQVKTTALEKQVGSLSIGAYAFIGDAGQVKRIATGIISIPAGIIVYESNRRIEFPFEQIIEMLGSDVAYMNGEELYISIGTTHALVFDITTRTLKKVNIARAGSLPYLALVYSYSANGLAGFLMDSTHDLQLRNLNRDVYAYITSANKISIINSTSFKYPASQSIAVVKSHSKAIYFTSEQVIEMIGSDYAAIVGDDLVITLDGVSGIYYDSFAENLVLLNGGFISDSRYYKLIGNFGYNGWTGPLVDTSQNLVTRELETSIDLLSARTTAVEGRLDDIAGGVGGSTDVFAFVFNGGTIKKTATGVCELTGGICVYYNGERYEFSHASIIEQLGEEYATVSGELLVLTLGVNYTLCFNRQTKGLERKLIASSTMYPYVALFTLYSAQGTTGALADTSDSIALTAITEGSNERWANSSPMYYDSIEWETKARAFSALFNTAGATLSSYVWFTDPHFMGSGEDSPWKKTFARSVATLQKVYNCVPCDFIVCGGDWLNNADTQAEACYKLGYISSSMRWMFDDKFYFVSGNHDTNYQGKLTAEDENWTGELSLHVQKNMWHRKRALYYAFEDVNARHYVLDTGLDSNKALNAYRYEQLHWLAEQLAHNDDVHASIFMHIVLTSSSDLTSVSPMATLMGNIIVAYNSRSSVDVDGTSYDFAACTGHLDYILFGHAHIDADIVLGGVPCIGTINTMAGGSLNFDIVLADYDNRKLHLVRVGARGEDRVFDI